MNECLSYRDYYVKNFLPRVASSDSQQSAVLNLLNTYYYDLALSICSKPTDNTGPDIKNQQNKTTKILFLAPNTFVIFPYKRLYLRYFATSLT